MFEFLTRGRSITRLTLDPPTGLPGREGLALVLIVRNEARHLGEWVRFHRLAGVRHIYAYDNGSTDSTLRVLEHGGDFVKVLPWSQLLRDLRSGAEIHNQVLAYAHAVSNFGGRYRWMSFIDTDEFLVPKQAGDLDGALAHLADKTNLSLPWHMFGRSGNLIPPAVGQLQGYSRRARDPMSNLRGVCNFKCIVDPVHVTGISVHAIQTDGRFDTVNDRGETANNVSRARRTFYSADHIQLNHYYSRSESEVAEKIGRGVFPSTKIGRHGERVREIIRNIEADEVEDRSALEFLARKGVRPEDLL
jgi:hypothetical protein